MRTVDSTQIVSVFLVCSAGWLTSAQSAILTVDPQGDGFKTIQQALDVAASGDTVQLVDATYTGAGNVNLDLGDKTITLCSVNGPTACIVDCAGTRLVDGPRGAIRGLTVLNSQQITIYADHFTLEDCVFKGSGQYNQPLLDIYHCRPTIVNCIFTDRSGDDGGVISCRGASPTIQGCTFESNAASLDAGAILNRGGSCPVITACRFVNNSCKDDGGAIANYEVSHSIIVACTFERNQSNDNGGAIFSRSGSCPRIVSCIFAGNHARSNGGAIYNRENAAAVVNCVFTGNSAHDNGGALYCNQTDEGPALLNCTLVGNRAELEGGAIYVEDRTNPNLLNCIIWANRGEAGDSETSQIFATAPTLRHCCVENWTGQWGDMSNHGLDPQFVDADGPDDVAGTTDDNLRLMGTSPCINAGLSEMRSDPFLTDCDGYPRIMGRLMDMGAYEYVVPPDVVAPEMRTYPRLDEDVIVINEARTWSPDGPNDWVELYNATDRQIHVGGWLLSDDVNSGLYEIASGTFIEPHGYLVLYQDEHFGNPADPGCLWRFALNREGDTLRLRSAYCGIPTGLRQEQALENFLKAGDTDTLGRHIKSDGTVDFVRLSVPTPGEGNAHPWVGPVVISEILFCRDDLGRMTGYLELCNTRDANASLDVSVEVGAIASPLFVEGPVAVPAQKRVLLADRPDLVRSAYGSAIGPDVEILSINTYLDWLGHGTALSLTQGFLTFDTVSYRHDWFGRSSWPAAADGKALAVTRIDPTRYGNDPNNWQLADPSPGE
ncbi:MAG: lamin tail domain-containing protein [Phycisphaerales bacterium]